MKFFAFGAEAQGVFAVGQIATGVIAIGQLATGVIAIGQVARGVIAIGQATIGIVAIGQVGIGVAYGAGMLGVGGLAGGLLPLGVWGRLPIGDLLSLELGGTIRSRIHPFVRLVVLAMVATIVWLVALGPLWESLFDIGGVLHQMS